MGPVLNSSFLNMKRLGVLLLPPGWDAGPSQGGVQHICWYPFVHLGEEKHCESKVSCLRTQHIDLERTNQFVRSYYFWVLEYFYPPVLKYRVLIRNSSFQILHGTGFLLKCITCGLFCF